MLVCWEVPKTTPRCNGFPEGLTGLSRVILTGVIYYSKRMQRFIECSLEETRHELPKFSPSRVPQDTLNSPALSCDNMWEMVSTGEARERLSALGLLSGAVHVGTPPHLYPIPDSQEESRC